MIRLEIHMDKRSPGTVTKLWDSTAYMNQVATSEPSVITPITTVSTLKSTTATVTTTLELITDINIK
jgi:hypothetical protein